MSQGLIVSLVILALMLVLFVSNRWRLDLVAVMGCSRWS